MILRAMGWLRKNLVALVVALVAMLGAGIFWSYHKGKIRKLEDERAIWKAREHVSALDARREALGERVEENAAEIKKVEARRVSVQREAVALTKEIDGMSDAEIAAAFRDLY